MKNICLYCGSSMGARAQYRAAAAEFGLFLAQQGIGLVYGGGHVGLMGVAADACLGAGGRVIGVIPETLLRWEVAHKGLSELHVVASMHARKAMMADLSDAFVALPGGFGTFDELFEILTWAQLGIHRKPIALWNVVGYFDRLLAALDVSVTEGFVRAPQRNNLISARTWHALWPQIISYRAAQADVVVDPRAR